jgi:hypothetical protein
VAHEVILPVHSALDFNEKWLWVQLFQLFAAKTVIMNIDWSFGVTTERKVLRQPVCVSSDFLS